MKVIKPIYLNNHITNQNKIKQMKNYKDLITTFNNCLKVAFNEKYTLTFDQLSFFQSNKKINTNDNNIFDGVIDIIVYAIGASWKIHLLTNKDPINLANDEQERNIVQRIINWNEQRNLRVFNFRREFSFLIEELFEATFAKHEEAHEISFKITDNFFSDLILNNQREFAVVQNFFIAIYKQFIQLGKEIATEYNPNDFYYYINLVMDANDKKGNKVDQTGKLVKDKAIFQAPETAFIKK